MLLERLGARDQRAARRRDVVADDRDLAAHPAGHLRDCDDVVRQTRLVHDREVGFDHLGWTRASAGLFLPVAQYTHNDLWQLRGHPVMFYYILLAATTLIIRLYSDSAVG